MCNSLTSCSGYVTFLILLRLHLYKRITLLVFFSLSQTICDKILKKIIFKPIVRSGSKDTQTNTLPVPANNNYKHINNYNRSSTHLFVFAPTPFFFLSSSLERRCYRPQPPAESHSQIPFPAVCRARARIQRVGSSGWRRSGFAVGTCNFLRSHLSVFNPPALRWLPGSDVSRVPNGVRSAASSSRRALPVGHFAPPFSALGGRSFALQIKYQPFAAAAPSLAYTAALALGVAKRYLRRTNRAGAIFRKQFFFYFCFNTRGSGWYIRFVSFSVSDRT